MILRQILSKHGRSSTQQQLASSRSDDTRPDLAFPEVPHFRFEVRLVLVTDPYIDAFFADLDLLNVDRADVYARATDHIDEMIDLIARLEKKGLAYRRDGSVYYSIERFPAYGDFARLDLS